MNERFESGYLPASHKILWAVLRVGLLTWGTYGLFHGSVVEFLEAIFAIIFTHLWDFFQIFGGFSFITRVDYLSQTMLNLFIFIGVVVGSTLNNRTAFSNFDIVTHFSAGFISAWFAYDFACTVQGPKRRLSPALAALFAIGFACFISVGWETYEFTMDRIYGLTLQRTAPMTDSGLTDTMIDEIIQASGGLIGMFSVAFVKNGKIGRNRRMYAKKAKAAEERELLKEQLLKDYLNEQKNNPRS